jgi:hypothetical protein
MNIKSIALALCLLFSSVVSAATPTLQTNSARFLLYSQASEPETRAFGIKLEQFDGMLRLFTNPKADDGDVRPLPVFLFSSGNELRRITELPPRTVGFYNALERGAFIAATHEEGADPNGLTATMILFHEYAHHFMFRYFPNGYPGWFVEGFAQLYSTIDFMPSGFASVGKPVPNAFPQFKQHGLYPLDRLLTLSGSEVPSAELSHYYATAWLLTHYLRVSGERTGELDLYLRAVATGRPSLEAAEELFSGGVSQLRRDLERYRQGRFRYFEVKGVPAPTLTLTTATAAKAALLRQEVQWLTNPGSDRAGSFIRSVRKIAPLFPNDPYAQSMAAEADRLAGDLVSAHAKAQRATTLDPKLVRAWMVQAAVATTRAESSSDLAEQTRRWNAARIALLAANRADPNAPEPLAEHFRWYKRQKLLPPDLAFEGLYRAHELNPQNVALRLETAWALVDRGAVSDAVTLVQPLINNPHDSNGRRAALQLRNQLLKDRD